MIDEFRQTLDMYESSLAQKGMIYMNQESGWYDNSGNLYPNTYSDSRSYSIRLSYTSKSDY